MMLFTMWTTLLIIALQIHNSEPKPVRPRGVKSNLTTHSLETGQTTKMSVTKPEATIYPISGTTMTLEITTNPASTLSREDVTTYLGDALRIAKDNDKSTLLEIAFRTEKPSINLLFVIAPQVYAPELTWGDVVSIVSSLLDYFKESGAWVETGFEIEDTKRRSLGRGLVGKLPVQK